MAGGGPPLSVARWRFGSGTAVLFFRGRTRFLYCDTAILAVLAIVVVLIEIVVLAVRAALEWLSCPFNFFANWGILAPIYNPNPVAKNK